MSKKEEVINFIKKQKTTLPLEIKRATGISSEEWEEIKKELILEGILKPVLGGIKCQGCPYLQSATQGAVYQLKENK